MTRAERRLRAATPYERRSEGLGRWAVRLLALLGCVLLLLSATGWWLSSRVLSADGFGDVVAKASQKQEVRDYLANQITLRLARESNFVSAARPVVTDAVSQAIGTPPVEEVAHELGVRVHTQVYRAHNGNRVDVDAQQAATTIRSVLETINPSLAKKLPKNVLTVSASVSQSSVVDALFVVGDWVEWLFIPLGVVGVGLLVFVIARARERVRAVRTVGVVLAAGGALLMGFGAATPAFAAVAGTVDPGRGDAVAAFAEVLLGRLLGGGQAIVLLGLLLAFAPGHDGGDLAARRLRFRAWIDRKRESLRWRIAGAVGLVLLGLLLLTQRDGLFEFAVTIGAIGVMYLGVVLALRATGVLVPGRATPPLHTRQVLGVAAAMVIGFSVTAGAAIAIASATTKPAAANAAAGCNGYVELCAQPLNQVMWAASHNAMNSAAYDFYAAEHTITIPEQLNAGVRALLLDAYYGYDDDGIVRTNLAGGVSRAQLEKEKGVDAVRELDRLGALTGTADTSGKKEDVYFCHDFCELGAVKASDILADVGTFLDQNLNEVVMIDVEDYVKPKDLRRALDDAGLLDRVWLPPKDLSKLPTLEEMVTPPKGEGENRRRLIITTEKHEQRYRWQTPTYALMQESPYDFASIQKFSCAPNRGGDGKPMFLLNHWLRADGPPDPVGAAEVNSSTTLRNRMSQCIAKRGRLPNVVAVDFTAVGDLEKTVNRYNAAIAKVTGVTRVVTDQLAEADLRRADRRLIEAHRLPKISQRKADELLGPAAAVLQTPPAVREADAKEAAAAAANAADGADGAGPAAPG